MKYFLSQTDRLQFTAATGETYTGGSQEWFDSRWKRESGCGPVAAANMIWYAARKTGGMDDYIRLMHDVFPCFSPKLRGISSAALFSRGLAKFEERHGAQTGSHLDPEILQIPAARRKRPGIGEVSLFLTSALTADTPAAFLSLSNGGVESLEHWHWVTIISFDTKTHIAEISDYGKQKQADLGKWLETSRLGGAMVYL